MNKRIKDLSLEINSIEAKAKNGLKNDKKALKNVRKEHPYKLDPQVSLQNGSLHGGSTFIVPVQNWQKGTVFDKKEKEQKKTHNIHSAKIMRNIPSKLTADEMDYIMERRHKLAENMLPIHHPEYELKPTTIEPIEKTHRKIWQEYA